MQRKILHHQCSDPSPQRNQPRKISRTRKAPSSKGVLRTSERTTNDFGGNGKHIAPRLWQRPVQTSGHRKAATTGRLRFPITKPTGLVPTNFELSMDQNKIRQHVPVNAKRLESS